MVRIQEEKHVVKVTMRALLFVASVTHLIELFVALTEVVKQLT